MTLLFILLFLFVLVQCTGLAALLQTKDATREMADWPRITIWVAARNEEAHIRACLEHLHKLDYPREKLEILVGNDQSEDATARIVTEYIAGKACFRLVEIGEPLGKARKKANVLAQLAHHSTGEYYLVCDADMEPQPGWAKALLAGFRPETGVVSATTFIKPVNLFARMQGLDWLYFLGLIKAYSDLGMPCTAVGNNMAVRKKAYWDCGGYENIDFSITEDFKLFREIVERGWGWKQLLNPESTSVSEPAPDLTALMRQRKRWLTGGRELPWYWKILLFIFGSFVPVLFILLFFFPFAVLCIWGVKMLVQSILLTVLLKRCRRKSNLPDILLYEAYTIFINIITPLFLVMPGGKNWKGRNFMY